jgi:hypothetical protein
VPGPAYFLPTVMRRRSSNRVVAEIEGYDEWLPEAYQTGTRTARNSLTAHARLNRSDPRSWRRRKRSMGSHLNSSTCPTSQGLAQLHLLRAWLDPEPGTIPQSGPTLPNKRLRIGFGTAKE